MAKTGIVTKNKHVTIPQKIIFNYPLQLPSNLTDVFDRLAQQKCLCGKGIVICFLTDEYSTQF